MTRRSTSEGLVSAIRVTAGLWCVNHEQGVRSERVHDRVDVPAGCGSTPGSSDCARVGPLSSRLTAKREDVGARAFGKSGNARMHGCEQRELRRQSPTALCSDGASGAAHRGPCRSTWLRAYHPSHSHPSSLVSCLTVGRDASRDISASATLTQPLSLALMSPDGSDRERSPLEPVKDNILLVAGEPPPLELPDPLKGPQAIEDEPEELMQEAEPDDDETSAETLSLSLPSCSSSSGTVLAASDEALAHIPRSQPLAMPMKRDSTAMQTDRSDFGLSSSAPAFASSAPAFAVSHPASLTVKRNEDDGAASAIQALLALQRDDSPGRAPQRSWSTLSDGEMSLGRVLSDSRTACLDACPSSPALSAQSMDERPAWPTSLVGGSKQGGKDGAARFYCRFPKCGKGYASTDAVRKHCRQRHLEWLRRLGHGCPALYCRWSADVLENVQALQDEDSLASPM